uniref:Complement component 5 n=1 Tax=Paramormyrops kingsleyae TaxID=1676925 RepID=A0A3B3S0A7_9TELE
NYGLHLLCAAFLCSTCKMISWLLRYLITAPKILRLDATERVVVQLFGYEESVTFTVSLKSYPDKRETYSTQSVTLTAENRHQDAVTLRLLPESFPKEARHVFLEAHSRDFTKDEKLGVTRENGFMFIQTDKPLYNPEQTVDIVQMRDVSGILSMPAPFKIPLKPKFGVWRIEATYTDDFSTRASAEFEVKEYVLPSISVLIQPELNYISAANFESFKLTVTARYNHGSPVSAANVFLRYGYIDGPNTILLPFTFRALLNSILNSAQPCLLLVCFSLGGISQEAELASVKFLQSPFTLSLIATPPFIKPGLPYFLKVLVTDPLGKPVGGVAVKVRVLMTKNDGEEGLLKNSGRQEGHGQTRNKDGTTNFVYNIPSDCKSAVFTLETADQNLPPNNQAVLRHETVAYHSINKRYLYIDWASHYQELTVGDWASINIYFQHYSNIPLESFSYQVISKGKIVKFDTVPRHTGTTFQPINFKVMSDMVPSARLLVYYIMTGETTAELVADSVWMGVKDKCINDLQVKLSAPLREYSPQDNLDLQVEARFNSLVALSSVDTAVYNLRAPSKDPLATVRFSSSCPTHCRSFKRGPGEVRGYLFTCSFSLLPVKSYKEEKRKCCMLGMTSSPFLDTCKSRADRLRNKYNEQTCKEIFIDCCEFRIKLQRTQANDQILALLCNVFLRSGLITLNRKLPDSLTTWEMRAVGMFSDGICVSDPLRVQVTQQVSLDVPLPYSMVRGEHLELLGSVYNQLSKDSWYCVTLAAPKEICLVHGVPVGQDGAQRTPCNKKDLKSTSVSRVSFTLMALEAGSHSLKFTLQSPLGSETVIKTLRVVPEGIKTELNIAGTLDPQAVYGTLRKRLEFKNSAPAKLVPKSNVERVLTISGELFGEVLAFVNDPNGLHQLTGLPRGSAEAEIMSILPVYYVFQFLEQTDRWELLGHDKAKSRMELKQKLREGVTSLMSFKKKNENGYSMWKDREASTWLVNKHVAVDEKSFCNSVFWLTSTCQNRDGSFKELSDYKPVKLMGAGAMVQEQTAFITSFAIIGIKTAMTVPACNLMEFKNALGYAATYLSDNFQSLKSLYVRAVTAYALALVDQGSMPARELYERLQNYAQVKGNPPLIRFWQEEKEPLNPSTPNRISTQSVETTVYVLLTAMLYGDKEYAAPILRWLTQDQRYGGGLHSTQDTILTLEALKEYSQLVQHSKLEMEIRASYRNKGDLDILRLSENHHVSRSIQVEQTDDVILTTGSSTGVSVANLKTVYYSMAESNDNCHFDLTIEIQPAVQDSTDIMFLLPRLIACAKYKPLENEVFMESAHTIMEIHLPTGIQPLQEDLDMMQNSLDSLVSHYEMKGDQVILQLDSIPSAAFLCVGFRIQELFRTGMTSSSLFKVYEYRDPGTHCSKLYYPHVERRFLRLCDGDECQCMAAECSNFKGSMDLTITAQMRLDAACEDKIKYAFKVKIESSSEEGDFVNYVAKIEDIFKKGKLTLCTNSEVTFVKKATCTDVNLQEGNYYLIMGAEGMERLNRTTCYRYKFPLDSQAWVERWPSSDCEDISCSSFLNTLEDFSETFLIMGCP